MHRNTVYVNMGAFVLKILYRFNVFSISTTHLSLTVAVNFLAWGVTANSTNFSFLLHSFPQIDLFYLEDLHNLSLWFFFLSLIFQRFFFVWTIFKSHYRIYWQYCFCFMFWLLVLRQVDLSSLNENPNPTPQTEGETQQLDRSLD